MIKKLINKLRHITMFEILTITWFKLRLMLRYGTIMQDDGKFWPHDGHSSRMLVTKIQDYMGDETQMLFDGKFWWATDQDGNLLSGCDKRDMVVAHITIHRQEREANAEKKALTEDSEKSDNKALPFKDREPKLMRGAPMTDDEDCCRPWVSPDDPHVTSDPQTYTGEDLRELGIEGGIGPQPLRLCGFCKTKLQPIEYCIWMTKDDGDLTIYPNDPEDLKARLITTRLTNFLTMEISNYAWLHCDECHAANWVGGDD